jgi:hypothetical protein
MRNALACGLFFLLTGCIIVHHIQPEFSQDGTVNIEIRTDSDDPNVNVAVDDVMVTWDELKTLMEMKKSGALPPAGAKAKAGATPAVSGAPAAPAGEPARTPETPKPTHSVQAGAYLVPQNARQQADFFSARGYASKVIPFSDPKGKTWYLVRIGDYSSAEEAQAKADEFSRKEGVPSAVRPYGRF